MNTLDTRDLIEERDELKSQILDDFNEKFNAEVEIYEDIDDFMDDFNCETDDQDGFFEYWEEEISTIEEINKLEDEVYNGEFESGTTLIEEKDFTEYAQVFLEDCGYISRDFPTWIVIDWDETADNVKQDYSEVEYRGTTYLYR